MEFDKKLASCAGGHVGRNEQTLYGQRYATTAWRIGAPDAFHAELGYWLWDPAAQSGMERLTLPQRYFHWLQTWVARHTASVQTNFWTKTSRRSGMSSLSLSTVTIRSAMKRTLNFEFPANTKSSITGTRTL
jgi:hypothetical protein